MTKIIVIEETSATQNVLEKCLQAGCQVLNFSNHSVKSLLDNISNIQDSESIFPAIPKLEKVFQFIELNYQEPISLKEVAQSVDYSGAYLSYLVRNLTGKTVTDWITERRLTQARNLLLKTNLSVYEIAAAVRYQTPNHFFKQFRNHHNVSPKAWRQTHNNH